MQQLNINDILPDRKHRKCALDLILERKEQFGLSLALKQKRELVEVIIFCLRFSIFGFIATSVRYAII